MGGSCWSGGGVDDLEVEVKTCPQCGYEPTKSNRQLMTLYRKNCGDIPVWDMIHRGWICGSFRYADGSDDEYPASLRSEQIVAMVRQELIRFFSLESETELDGFIAGRFEPPLTRNIRTCNVEPERIC